MNRLCAVALFAILVSAQARAADTAAPVIEHTPLSSAPRGAKWLQIFAKITDDSKFFPQVFYRYGPGEYQKPVDMKAVKGEKHMFGGNVPIKGDLVEYYIEAYDELGNGPGRSGDPDRPWRVDTGGMTSLQAEVIPPKPQPVPPPARPAPKPPPARTVVTQQQEGGRTWTWIVGGVGVGALAGGLVAGSVFKTEDDAYKARLGDGSAQYSSLKQQYDANKSLGRDATILMIAGGALVATSVVLFFVEAPSSSGKYADANKSQTDFRVAAAPIDGGGAVAVAGRF